MVAPLLSIIVVSYNTKDMTLACLQSIVDETSSSYEVIVIDNLSVDGSAEAIATRFPQFHLISSRENLGFAKANNVAAEQALGEYLLLLNPDTLILDGAIDTLLSFARQHPDAKIWGGRTLDGSRNLDPTSCWGKQTLWGMFCRATGTAAAFSGSSVFNQEGYGSWKRDSERQVDIVTGCFLMIRRDFWNRLSGFDSRFFMYGEEADLCLRAHQLGAAPMFTPNATIIHYGGASETVRADKLVRLLRAKAQLISRHWSPLAATLGIGLMLAWVLRLRATYAILLKVRGSAWQERAEAWASVWRRRAEWSRVH